MTPTEVTKLHRHAIYVLRLMEAAGAIVVVEELAARLGSRRRPRLHAGRGEGSGSGDGGDGGMTTFTVPGTPVAKGRPRVVRVNGISRAITPKRTVDYENRVRFAAEQAGVTMIEGPVRLTIAAYWLCPKSRYRKRVPRPEEIRTTKPDLDNVVKAIADALNGIAYADDSQVAMLGAWKMTAAQGEPAKTVVEVEGMNP